MRFAFVQDHLRSGGTERQTLFLADALAQAGHETHVVVFRPGGALGRSPAPATPEPGRAFRRALQPFDSGLDGWAPGLSRTLRGLRADAVVLCGRTAHLYGRWLRWRLPSTTALVATLRTGRSLPWLYVQALAAADLIVANSAYARARVLALPRADPRRVVVVRNPLLAPPLEGEAAAAARARLRAETGAGPGCRILLNVAMFRPGKRHDRLVELGQRLAREGERNWQLWLVGDGPTRSVNELRASRAGLADRVRFFGLQADPRPWLAAADLLLHVSDEESLPNAVIEAQAAGLPALALDTGGVAECLPRTGGGCLLSRAEPPLLAAAIRAAWGDPLRLRQWSAEARTHARHAFDPARQVAAWARVLAAATDGAQRPGETASDRANSFAN